MSHYLKIANSANCINHLKFSAILKYLIGVMKRFRTKLREYSEILTLVMES